MHIYKLYVQKQAEANRNGVWVLEKMVWITEWAKQETTQGGGGAEGYQSGRPPLADADAAAFRPHNVPSLPACHRRRRH